MKHIEIDWRGPAIGAWVGHEESTVVRPTRDGRFAVIGAASLRVFKVFKSKLEARRYNFSMHGDSLGE